MAASTEEITAAVDNTSKIAEQTFIMTTESVSSTVEQNELVEYTTVSIEKLSKMANDLKELTSKFKL
jgi:methyl-accepting chemotaxis protein